MSKVVVPVVLLFSVLCGCAGSPEQRRDRFMAKGKELFEKKEYSRSLIEFRNAAQAKPQDAEPYYQLGLAAAALGDIRTAYLSFGKATSLDPKHAGAQLKLAQMLAYGEIEQVKDAQQRLKTAAQQGLASDPEVLNTLAFTEIRLGKVEDAVATLERAVKEAPGELMSAVLLSRTRLFQKDIKGAEAALRAACENAPASADARRILGEFYLTQARYADAGNELKRAFEMNPKSAATVYDLALLSLSLGNKQEGETRFRQLSGFEGYQSSYAFFLFQEGRKDEAVRELERLFKQNSEDRGMRSNLVAAYLSAGRNQEAVNVLESAIAKNAKDGDALLQRAEILIRNGKLAEAETDLNQVRRLRSAAPEVHYVAAKLHEARGTILTYRQELSDALRLNPLLESVRVELAQHLVNRNEARAALDLLKAAPDMQKSSNPILIQRNWAHWALGDLAEMRKGIDEGLARQRSVDFLLQDALWKMSRSDNNGARAALEEALQMDPSDTRALQFLTESYTRTKNVGPAVQRLREYVAKQPKSASAHYLLGSLLMASGDRAAAKGAFLAAKNADPQFADADFSLAQLDLYDRDVEAARKKVDALVAANSGNVKARQWLAGLQLVSGDRAAAIENFRKVVELDPRNAEALNNLAYLLSERDGEIDQSLKYAERAVELAPDKPAYCDTLGWILYRKGVYGSAIRYLERADKGDALTKYHLAMAYVKGGDRRKGKAVYEAALKINPNLPEAKTAREVVGAY